MAAWQTVKTVIAAGQGKGPRTKEYKEARTAYQGFLSFLHLFQVLDPACGSGNFLYLALKALRDLEKQVRIEAQELGLEAELLMQTGPHNIRGIEINEFAAELARVTVWIGDIQWCRRNGREIARDPILRPLDGIENRDALLNPDNSEATWPKADVIVGNPPFLGGSKMLGELGEDYVTRLRKRYDGRVPGGADLVTYWFEKARAQIEDGNAQTAGLVATNSIRGGANREVLKQICASGRIFNAWSDEAWVNEGAAVRVSLICFDGGDSAKSACHTPQLNGIDVAEIYADLTAATGTVGGDLTTAKPLMENTGICYLGTKKGGNFDVPGWLAQSWLAMPNPHGKPNSDVLRPWVNGTDIVKERHGKWIVDFGTGISESDAALYEAPFAHVLEHVKPEREKNNREIRRRYWWRFSETMPALRKAIAPLSRYIVSSRVSKYRIFSWRNGIVMPDDGIVVIASDDDTTFGILHSRFHELWSLGLCTWMGKGNDPRYTPTTCFETFPFPEHLTPLDTANKGQCASDTQADSAAAKAIAEAAVKLNQLRENWLNPPEWVDWVITPEEEKAGCPKRPVAKPGYEADIKKRTLTNLYNARPAWLDMAHKTLDKTVAAAYGWEDYTPDLSDGEILHRLLALNLKRSKAVDAGNGTIREPG